MASIGSLLQQRRFSQARPLLETLLQLQPEHPEALYNLSVLASEEGKPEEARLLLRDKAEARQALEAAIELEPQNSFALRSLGRLLVIAEAFAAGVARFRQALALAPGDLITTVNLAQALLELDPDEHRDEADRLLQQVIEAQTYGELANKAKDLRGSRRPRSARRSARGVAAGRCELLPPGPAAVRGDGSAALHCRAQRGGGRGPGGTADQ